MKDQNITKDTESISIESTQQITPIVPEPTQTNAEIDISNNTVDKKGHPTTGSQCAAKLRNLKKTYKSMKDHNNLSGNNRRTWQFYEIMDDIFSKRAWCSSVAVASTGLSVKQVKDSELFVNIESTSELLSTESVRGIKRKEPSASKENMYSLFKKKLDQRNEHEKAKAERHKEKHTENGREIPCSLD